MTDGFGVFCYGDNQDAIVLKQADDFQFSLDGSAKAVRWWGSYPGWQSATSGEVNSPASLEGLSGNYDWPAERPVLFAIDIYEYLDGTPPQPGPLMFSDSCRSYSEAWAGAVEKWDAPGTYEHVYKYEGNFTSPRTLVNGERYFLSIRALYTSDTTALGNRWAWFNSAEHWNAAAVRSELAGAWIEQFWPAGHRLDGQPMDMAFELWADTLPTPIPTPSPTPSPTPAPTAVPPVWHTLAITAPNGFAARLPDQPGYEPGTVVRLNASADPGYEFLEWSGDVPPEDSLDNPLELTMDGDKNVTANYVTASFVLNVQVENGWAELDPIKASYDYGDAVTITAHFNSGWEFGYWRGSIPPDANVLQNPVVIVVDHAHDITAASVPNVTPTPSPTPVDPTDTDGDGFSDAIENLYGSIPTDPNSTPDFGDADGDGRTNILDALLLARAMESGSPPPYDSALDVNMDGVLDIHDAWVLYAWSIGLPGFEALPVVGGRMP